MTETLTIRLPKKLAQDLKAKTRAAKTTPSTVLRRLAAEYVRNAKGKSRNAMQEHIAMYAGSWAGHCSGEELLQRTRP